MSGLFLPCVECRVERVAIPASATSAEPFQHFSQREGKREKKEAKRAVDIVAIGDEIDVPFALLSFSNDDDDGEP